MQGSRIDVVKSEAGLDRWVGFLMKEVMHQISQVDKTVSLYTKRKEEGYAQIITNFNLTEVSSIF